MKITLSSETPVNISATGLGDIVSDYCNLPTGIFSIEFIPRHEIYVWQNGIPLPTIRWYGISAYRDSLTYDQPTTTNVHGATSAVQVGCLVVNDTQAVADQLDQMQRMRFVLRVTHFDGKRRYVGAPGEFCELEKTDFSPTEIIGAQGYRLNFTGLFSKRPLVV